jgi:serine/threonine protein kinase, bacterial
MNILRIILSLIFALSTISCGRRPADLLRQNQAPVYDFPLFVSVGDGSGTILKFERDGTSTTFVSGLNDPRGITIDRYNNLYVVEYGSNRVLKYKTTDASSVSVVVENLQTPSVVAVDSFGEVYVNQEGANNIIRARDGFVKATYADRPTALAFGVNDLMMVGLFDSSQVLWGAETTSPSDSIQEPVMIATDGTGRVYVAEGTFSNSRVYRYHQTSPTGKTVVADALSGATGIAVDSVGNVYVAEAGASRISLVTNKNELFYWANVVLPQYMAFTQY